MIKVSHKNALLALITLGILVSIVLVANKLLYPPLFRSERVIVMRVYNRICGRSDHRDMSGFRAASDGLYCEVYLVSNHDSGSPSFQGNNLKVERVQGRHQYEIMGEGHILWNTTDIEVKPSGITINGKLLKQGIKSVAIKQDGSFGEHRVID